MELDLNGEYNSKEAYVIMKPIQSALRSDFQTDFLSIVYTGKTVRYGQTNLDIQQTRSERWQLINIINKKGCNSANKMFSVGLSITADLQNKHRIAKTDGLFFPNSGVMGFSYRGNVSFHTSPPVRSSQENRTLDLRFQDLYLSQGFDTAGMITVLSVVRFVSVQQPSPYQ